MKRFHVLVAFAAAMSFVLVGCSSTDDVEADPTASVAPSFEGGELDMQWGTVDTAASPATMTLEDTPVSVDEATTEVLVEGTGATVPQSATVSVHYLGVNGTTGEKFDSSFDRGQTATFSLNQVVPGFSKAIAGQNVGAQLVTAFPPADGYGPQGQPGAGIGGEDTLVFYIWIEELVS